MWFFGILFVLLLAGYLAFQTSTVQTFLVRQIADRLSERLDTRITLERVDIRFFNKIILNKFLIEDQQQDTLFFVDEMVASIDQFSWDDQTIELASLEMNKTKLFAALTEEQVPNYKFILDALRTRRSESGSWSFSCENFLFSDTRLGYSYFTMEKPRTIDLHDIDLDVTDFILNHDSLSFQINNLSLDDHKDFRLSSLSTRLVSYNHVVKLNNLKVSTPYSSITDADIAFDQTEIHEGKDFSHLKLDVNLKESAVNFQDVSQLVPSLRGMDLKINLSGHVYGTVGDLKAKDLQMSLGQNTKLVCDFYSNGLPDLDQTYILLDLKKSTADFKDLGKIRLPYAAKSDYLSFSDMLYDAGIVHYEGNFTGFLSDFVAYGTVRSNFGQIKTDLSFVPTKGDLLKVNGHVKTVNFALGEFTQSKRLGDLTFNGQVDGALNKASRRFDITINGLVDSLIFNDYQFENLSLNGAIQNQKFEGEFGVEDPALNANFKGKMDFNPAIPEFDFDMLLEKADLKALNLDQEHETSMLAMGLKAEFKGNSIDNLDGGIWLESGQYYNENDTLELTSLSINTYADSLTHLLIRSDFADANISGRYSFRTFGESLKKLLHQYLPSAGIKFRDNLSPNQFDFDLTIKDAEPLTRTFSPSWYVAPTHMEGRFDDQLPELYLNVSIPHMEYKNMVFNGYWLSIRANDKLEFKNRLEEIQLNNNQRIYNVAVLADAEEDRVNSKLVWNNFHEKTYSGELETQIDFKKSGYKRSHVKVDVIPSKIYIADTLWQVHPATITIDSSRVEVEGLKLSNYEQQLAIDGVVSKDKNDRLNMKVNGIDLSNLNILMKRDLGIKGVLNGTASVFDVYERALFLSDLRIKGLQFREHEIGDVSTVSKWDRISEAIHSELKVNKKGNQSLHAFGEYKPGTDSLDFTARLNDFSLAILQPVLERSFKDVRGRGTGEVWIHGTPEKILMDGDVLGLDAGLAMRALQVNYYFSDTVYFRSDSIIFDQIEISDYQGNKGIFDGSIRHDNFSNMDYNLSLRSPRILVMNTTIRDNERFYGEAYGSGVLQVGGHGKDVELTAAATSLYGTSINISLDYEEEAQEYDFIHFVDEEEEHDHQEIRRLPVEKSSLNMNFDIDVTPEAQVQLIYNSQIGDVIRSRGNGNLQVRIDPDFNITMFGEYRVDRGDYLFTLQNVFNKKFEIAQGGTILWNGDPYDATIDIDAIYRLKASLSELAPPDMGDRVDYSQRIPVACQIFLTENLNNPEIAFGIDFPAADDRIKDLVQQVFSTEEEMNKQILSLLVLGRFYTPEYLKGSYGAANPNLVGSTASELFSNQLSNWLSQISNDFDIGVNYRPGNQISNDEIELALSTQIFNDRVTLNGNIGNNGTAATSSSNNNNIVGDFDLNVKLTNNGKLQLKAYNRSNDNLIYETSPYTQGIGLSFRENYDTFGELWEKFKNLFMKSRKD